MNNVSCLSSQVLDPQTKEEFQRRIVASANTNQGMFRRNHKLQHASHIHPTHHKTNSTQTGKKHRSGKSQLVCLRNPIHPLALAAACQRLPILQCPQRMSRQNGGWQTAAVVSHANARSQKVKARKPPAVVLPAFLATRHHTPSSRTEIARSARSHSQTL